MQSFAYKIVCKPVDLKTEVGKVGLADGYTMKLTGSAACRHCGYWEYIFVITPIKPEGVIQLEEPAPMPPHPCSDPELASHCSGCTTLKNDRMGGTHQGCTIEHGHVGCNLSTSDAWPAK